MLELLIGISEVDYCEIADKVVPIVVRKITEKDNSNRMIKILSKYKNLPNIAINKALAILPQNIKDEIVINLIEFYEDKLLSAFNDFLSKKSLDITFRGINVSKKENMELVFVVDDIDYSSVIIKGYPVAIEKIKDNKKFEKIARLLMMWHEYSEKLIQAAFDALSQDEKDDFVICMLDSYEDEILKFINSWAASNQITVSLAGMEVRKV